MESSPRGWVKERQGGGGNQGRGQGHQETEQGSGQGPEEDTDGGGTGGWMVDRGQGKRDREKEMPKSGLT